MKLLIDSGNSRIKWAYVQGDTRLNGGTVPTAEHFRLAERLASSCGERGGDLKDVEQIWISNVAGEQIALHIGSIDDAWKGKTRFIVSRREQCGVKNTYEKFETLGVDRWAGLIAAWSIVGKACLVVNCGTATTIDVLSAQGEFLGGLIIPGITLMQNSLYAATAGLRPMSGDYEPFPRSTQNGIFSGSVQATCGAIQRQYELLKASHAQIVLSGGAAEELDSHLNMPILRVEDLVLHGLHVIAREETAA
jgi:type III pantothenate kinase